MNKFKRTITLTYKWKRSDGKSITKDQLKYLDNTALDAFAEDLKVRSMPSKIIMELKGSDKKSFFKFEGVRIISLRTTCKGDKYDTN
jgi:hypothetical protein